MSAVLPTSGALAADAARAVRAWLDGLALEKYADAFLAQDIGPDLLPDLTDADLRELGVASLGDRKRLLKAAARLALEGSPDASAAEPPGACGRR